LENPTNNETNDEIELPIYLGKPNRIDF